MQRLLPRLGLVAIAALLLAGCNPLLFHSTGGGAGTGPCLPGTWALDTQQYDAPIHTPIGDIMIKTAGAGTSLAFTDTEWTLNVDETLSASLTTNYGSVSGSVIIKGDAHGTYSTNESKITFTLAQVTGSATYDATVLGVHLGGSVNLPTSGFESLVGLHGTASYTCAADALSFSLPPLTVHAHK